ncbi:MAG: HD domain-containing protein [Clostridia bacterium]|nr:HD domain-containing protein [Clostridia bacterium]
MEIRELLMATQIGISVVLIIFCIINTTLSETKKMSLLAMTVMSMNLAISDCLANSNTTELAIRFSKFMVYWMPLMIILAFNHYLSDFLQKEKTKIVEWIILFATVNLIISQFTGMYYIVDANGYHRGEWYVISYVFPLIATGIQMVTIIKNRKGIRKKMLYPMILFILLPIIASVFHIFLKGISLVSITVVFMIVLLYSFSILDTNKQLELAHKKEIEILQEKESLSQQMIEQITSALVETIDAKDSYTQGHSRRVSEYACMIAKKAGKDEQECKDIKFIALLHDVGKIGISSSIINKEGKLTEEEYQIMKKHPIIGRDILDKITINANLRIGACFHHERYDGKGYPFGLKGDEIPEVARIIAVADAYDAMTSKRSYRDSLPQKKVREELVKGTGKQFDPFYANIMIELVDEDKDYKLRQN